MERLKAPARIGASVARGLLVPMAEQGLDGEALLEECGVDSSLVDDPNHQILLEQYLAFINLAAAKTQDPLIGIRLARSAGPETLGAIGFLFLSSPTLGNAITNLCHYLNLLQDVTILRCKTDNDTIIIYYDIEAVGGLETRQDIEFSIALTSRLIRIYSGQEIAIEDIKFRHSPAKPVVDYENLLKAPVFFEQDDNSISLKKEYGVIPSTIIHDSLSDILKASLDRELQKKNLSATFVDKVKLALFEMPPGNIPTSHQMAQHLGVSPATFFRMLEREGSSFQYLIDTHRFTIVCDYLRESDMSITEIGRIAGYAETASFSRAFSRWSKGVTPSAYRKNSAQQ